MDSRYVGDNHEPKSDQNGLVTKREIETEGDPLEGGHRTWFRCFVRTVRDIYIYVYVLCVLPCRRKRKERKEKEKKRKRKERKEKKKERKERKKEKKKIRKI